MVDFFKLKVSVWRDGDLPCCCYHPRITEPDWKRPRAPKLFSLVGRIVAEASAVVRVWLATDNWPRLGDVVYSVDPCLGVIGYGEPRGVGFRT